MKKQIIHSLVVLILLSGCNTGTVSPETQQQEIQQETKPEIQAPIEKKAVAVPPEPESKPKPAAQPLPPSTVETTQTAQPAPASKPSPPSQPQPKAETPKTASPTPKLPSPPPPVQEKQQETVKLSITGDAEQGVILPLTEVKVEKGDSVLDALQRVLKEKGIQMEYSGTKGMAYVEGINNLYEFDHGPKSGWMFRVNGTFASKSAGSFSIQPGDQIEWLYTLDLGRDLGSKVVE